MFSWLSPKQKGASASGSGAGPTEGSKPKRQAFLGEKENKFYYDEQLKRWRVEGEEEDGQEEAALNSPPRINAGVHTHAFQNSTSEHDVYADDSNSFHDVEEEDDREPMLNEANIASAAPSAQQSAPSFFIPGDAREDGSGVHSQTNHRMYGRSRYVDTLSTSTKREEGDSQDMPVKSKFLPPSYANPGKLMNKEPLPIAPSVKMFMPGGNNSLSAPAMCSYNTWSEDNSLYTPQNGDDGNNGVSPIDDPAPTSNHETIPDHNTGFQPANTQEVANASIEHEESNDLDTKTSALDSPFTFEEDQYHGNQDQCDSGASNEIGKANEVDNYQFQTLGYDNVEHHGSPITASLGSKNYDECGITYEAQSESITSPIVFQNDNQETNESPFGASVEDVIHAKDVPISAPYIPNVNENVVEQHQSDFMFSSNENNSDVNPIYYRENGSTAFDTYQLKEDADLDWGLHAEDTLVSTTEVSQTIEDDTLQEEYQEKLIIHEDNCNLGIAGVRDKSLNEHSIPNDTVRGVLQDLNVDASGENIGVHDQMMAKSLLRALIAENDKLYEQIKKLDSTSDTAIKQVKTLEKEVEELKHLNNDCNKRWKDLNSDFNDLLVCLGHETMKVNKLSEELENHGFSASDILQDVE